MSQSRLYVVFGIICAALLIAITAFATRHCSAPHGVSTAHAAADALHIVPELAATAINTLNLAPKSPDSFKKKGFYGISLKQTAQIVAWVCLACGSMLGIARSSHLFWSSNIKHSMPALRISVGVLIFVGVIAGITLFLPFGHVLKTRDFSKRKSNDQESNIKIPDGPSSQLLFGVEYFFSGTAPKSPTVNLTIRLNLSEPLNNMFSKESISSIKQQFNVEALKDDNSLSFIINWIDPAKEHLLRNTIDTWMYHAPVSRRNHIISKMFQVFNSSHLTPVLLQELSNLKVKALQKKAIDFLLNFHTQITNLFSNNEKQEAAEFIYKFQRLTNLSSEIIARTTSLYFDHQKRTEKLTMFCFKLNSQVDDWALDFPQEKVKALFYELGEIEGELTSRINDVERSLSEYMSNSKTLSTYYHFDPKIAKNILDLYPSDKFDVLLAGYKNLSGLNSNFTNQVDALRSSLREEIPHLNLKLTGCTGNRKHVVDVFFKQFHKSINSLLDAHEEMMKLVVNLNTLANKLLPPDSDKTSIDLKIYQQQKTQSLFSAVQTMALSLPLVEIQESIDSLKKAKEASQEVIALVSDCQNFVDLLKLHKMERCSLLKLLLEKLKLEPGVQQNS